MRLIVEKVDLEVQEQNETTKQMIERMVSIICEKPKINEDGKQKI